jgi:hypothetical protein
MKFVALMSPLSRMTAMGSSVVCSMDMEISMLGSTHAN